MKNFLRRAGALAAAVMMCFALAVPAAAAGSDFTGGVTFAASVPDSPSGAFTQVFQHTLPVVSVIDSFSNSGGAIAANMKWVYVTSKDIIFSGPVGFYFSYMPSCAKNNASGLTFSCTDGFYDLSSYNATARSVSTGANELYSLSLSTFTPTISQLADAGALGLSFSAHFNASIDDPIYWPSINSVLNSSGYPIETFSYTNGGDCTFYITSIRLVATEYSAELDQLEDIANSIVAQSEILSAFYGDIVAICNEIYQRLGDMQQTQEEANALLSSLISLLNTTNSKISSLNQAMSTYFELVLKSLANESLSIQDCIDDAEARLELYLKPMIDYFVELEEQTGESAATLPQHKTDIDGFDNQGYGIDGDGQAGLAALLPIFGSFSWIFSVIAIFIGVGIINLLVKKGMS